MGIAQDARKNLLAIAQAYAKATGLSLASVSRKFHGNQAFLKKFEQGKDEDGCSVTIDMLETMVEKFRAQWPKDAPWPAHRPLWMG